MPYFSFVFVCCVWGGSFILMDRASLALGPVAIGMGRLSIGAFVLAAYWTWLRAPVRLKSAEWGHVFVVAVLGNSLPFVVQPYVMIQAQEHAYFGMMVALVPIATLLISIPMLGIFPSRRQLIGVIGGLLCMVAIVHDGSQRGITTGLIMLALSVPVSYAFCNAYIKWKLDHLPAVPITTMFLAIGAGLLLPLQFSPDALQTLGMAAPEVPRDWPVAVAAMLFLGAIGTGVGVLLFIQMVKHQGPLFAGMVTYVIPVLALLWGQYDNENLTSMQLAAIVGVLAMVVVVQWGAASPLPSSAEPTSY